MSYQIKIPDEGLPRLVIIGGGFSGIQLIRNLKTEDIQIVLIDRHNYHTFQPLLYQVATAGLEPDSIASPFRKMFNDKKNFYFRNALVEQIIPEDNLVITSLGALPFDYLVIASGTRTNFYGLEDVQENAMPIKTIPQALNLRSLILQNFENAILSSTEEEYEALMNIVVVGAGPTGVEISGALGELRKYILPEDYPELNLEELNIHLVEMMDRVLPTMSARASKKSLKFLKNLEINVQLRTGIDSYDGKKVKFNNGRELLTSNVIWAAGVKGFIIDGLQENTVVGSRYIVDEFNRVKGYDNIFAVGDVALMRTDEHPNGHPMVAPVAIQQGKLLGENLSKILKGQNNLVKFKYQDKGALATIGRKRAVADLPNMKMQGFTAWLVWLLVHIYYIIGFRNKLVVFMNWVYNYITYDMGNRLIIRPYPNKHQSPGVIPPDDGKKL